MPDDKLSGLIDKLIASGASDDDIQFFVNDYKATNAPGPFTGPLQEQSQPSLGDKLKEGAGGFAKGVANTLSSAIEDAQPATWGRRAFDTAMHPLDTLKGVGDFAHRVVSGEPETVGEGLGALATGAASGGIPAAAKAELRAVPFGIRTAGKATELAGKGAEVLGEHSAPLGRAGMIPTALLGHPMVAAAELLAPPVIRFIGKGAQKAGQAIQRGATALSDTFSDEASASRMPFDQTRIIGSNPEPWPMRAPIGAPALPPHPVEMGAAPDTSFVRGVPAQPAMAERLGLPAPAMQMPAAPDASFVRGIPAELPVKEGELVAAPPSPLVQAMMPDMPVQAPPTNLSPIQQYMLQQEAKPGKVPVAQVPKSRSSGAQGGGSTVSGTPGLTVNDMQTLGLNPEIRLSALTQDAIDKILDARKARGLAYREEARLRKLLEARMGADR